MANATTEAVNETTAAVNEATRIAAEATRRGVEGAKASMRVAQSYIDESTALGRDVYAGWAAAGEAMLRAGIELQNAALDAGLALFDATVSTTRSLAEQSASLTRLAQRTTLESYQAGVRLAAKVAGETGAVGNPKR